MGDAAQGPFAGRHPLVGRLEAASGRVRDAAARVRAATGRPWTYLVVLVLASAAWILLWASYDAVLLTGAFPSAPAYEPNLVLYWEATWWVLFPISTFLIFRRHAWFPILALAVGGWEDVLFYLVQGHGVPSALAYLPQTPTAELLYLRAVLFLIAGLAGAVVTRLRRARIPFVPLEIIMLLAAVFVSFWAFVVSIPAYVGVRILLDRRARSTTRR